MKFSYEKHELEMQQVPAVDESKAKCNATDMKVSQINRLLFVTVGIV